MPWPADVAVAGSGALPIDISFSVSLSGEGSRDPRIKAAVERLFSRLSRQTGIPTLPRILTASGDARLNIVVESADHKAPQRLGDEESYSLVVSADRARLSATHPLGVLRGMDTFLQLVEQNKTQNGAGIVGFSIPAVTIRDQPRFPWRGISLDVSRHFIPAGEIERTIDGMAAVKLNVLHWHLSDDQGFRVESRKYPRLQKYGSDGLFYTQAEIRDVVEYARDRGVRVVPEFDMPGHATSMLVGYPSLGVGPGPYEIVRGSGIFSRLIDPTKESTYRFLDGFVGEMAKLFPDEYFHIGGDEVDPKDWTQNARVRSFMRKHHLANGNALQTYFNKRLLKIVTKHHKHMEGWDEVLQPDLPKSIVIESWRGQPSLWQAAKEGFQGILAAGYYLDLMYPASYHYAIDPMKAPGRPPGTYGEPKPEDPKAPAPGTPADLTPEQSKLILGGEAAMWEELATPENLDAKLWPRMAAIAERFWSPVTVTDLPSMYRRLALTNKWLEWLGLTQRTGLELMRQRLAGVFPYQAVDTFASILEPVKGYSRHAERYSLLSSFNRLVDTLAPESDAARTFRETVDAYLAAPKNASDSEALRERLALWLRAATEVRPALQQNSLLTENIAISYAVESLCRTGQEAISYLDGSATQPVDWKQHAQTVVDQYAYKRVGDILIPIAPGVAKLVAAVPAPAAK